MKLKKAKKIIGNLSLWFMYSQGIPMDTPEFIDKDIDLKVLILANELVKAHNREVIETDVIPKKLHTTFDDRAIAAAYVAMNYNPSNTPHIIVNMVGCCTVKMEE